MSANNVLAQPVADVVFDFTEDAEATDDVVASSSVENTIAKIINVPGATPLAPTSEDLVAATEVMPPDVEALLLNADRTATQVNLRLAPASLEERAVVVERLEADLTERIAELDLPEDSVLLAELEDEFGTASLFRPYRDVRFSKDKTPYKTHLPRAWPWSVSACCRTCPPTAPSSPIWAWHWLRCGCWYATAVRRERC